MEGTSPRAPGRWSRRTHARSHPDQRTGRAVAEVVATILLLSLTVTLFSSIFFFVSNFPSPPAQSANQFQASLLYNGSTVTNVRILHLAGPTLTSNQNLLFYIRSAVYPRNYVAPYNLSQGLAGSNIWTLGETWNISLAPVDNLPDNLTVSIISTTQLIFSVVLPGHAPTIPPVFASDGSAPAYPGVGQGFEVYVVIQSRYLNPHSVYVNCSQLPGASGALLAPQVMTRSTTPGEYVFSIPNGTTNLPGTYYVFVNASNSASLGANSIAVPIPIGEGGSRASIITVNPSTSPSSPTVGSAVMLGATVSDWDGAGGAVTVNFLINGAAVGSASGAVAGLGNVSLFYSPWTPAAAGGYTLTEVVTVAGVGTTTVTMPFTVYP